MNQLQRTTDDDVTDYMMTLRDCLLAAKAEGKDLDELIRDMNRALKRRLVREKRERAA